MNVDSEKRIEFEEIPCPLCGSIDEQQLRIGHDNLYGVPGDFRLVRCRACRHVYINPRPTLATIGLCYPEFYGPYQNGDRSEVASVTTDDTSSDAWYLSPSVRRIPGLRRLYYWLADSKSDFIPAVQRTPRTALEIGCSTGKFLARLRKDGWEASGVELAETPAREAARQGFDVHVGTLESAAFPTASFDAVFGWHVIEHLHEPKQTLQEIHRILKPRGWIAFSMPNFASWERKLFGQCWYTLELPRHLHHFSPKSLRKILSETGFDSIEIIHQRNLLNVVGSLGIAWRRKFPHGTLGQRLIDFTDQPTMWWQLCLAPLAKLLAFLRQGGRLTVIARSNRKISDSHSA
jgi:SAM-dependent methyltransferase